MYECFSVRRLEVIGVWARSLLYLEVGMTQVVLGEVF
jgi:hypothetical protein